MCLLVLEQYLGSKIGLYGMMLGFLDVLHVLDGCSKSVEGKVDQLIGRGRMEWKIDKLKACVSSEEIKAIQCIPILLRDPPDRLLWPFEKSGELTVRSAYNFISSNKSKMETNKASSFVVVE